MRRGQPGSRVIRRVEQNLFSFLQPAIGVGLDQRDNRPLCLDRGSFMRRLRLPRMMTHSA
jgi:hypothetical protein